MIDCDVLIVGGGPAGSSCAWGLRDCGLEVLVLDRAEFPRDKTCAGWVTPPVWEMLQIDLEDYQTTRTLQPITGFRTAILGDVPVETRYGEVVSYGIRRCEFDTYLLQRCGARLMTGCPVQSLVRDDGRWMINGDITARMLVGAGGNFCPVARICGEPDQAQSLVRAQEIEFEIEAQEADEVSVAGEFPELYFCSDLGGYGWCFRKGNFLNIGMGHVCPERLKADLAELCGRLLGERRLVSPVPARRHGHAYRLYCGSSRAAIAEALMLVGDAAGLADPRSGEGIRPAVESGLAAARTLQDAAGDYQIARLRPYQNWLQRRFGGPPSHRLGETAWLTRLRSIWGRALLRSRWFSRHVLLDRWFLHRNEQPAGWSGIQPVITQKD